jgi:hypothetical protein
VTPRTSRHIVWGVAAGLAVTFFFPSGSAAQARSGDAVQRAEPSIARPVVRAPAAGRALVAGDVSIDEVEAVFDQAMLRQARMNLSLGPGQLREFGAGFRRLQTARRQAERQRRAAVRELNTLLETTPFDEAAAAVRLQQVDDETRRADDVVRAAYEAIDRTLDIRQRVRFRVFEEAMERRKLELLTRARQQARRSSAAPQ